MDIKDRQVDTKSVFVRGVSFDVTDAKFTEAFSAVGPVRHAFLVKGGRDGRHKGYGFVQYALEEDAERAVAELHSTDLGGRKIKVESAVKRASFEERKGKRKSTGDEEPAASEDDEQPSPAPKKSRPSAAAAPAEPQKRKKTAAETAEKHALVRTIALGGLTPESVAAAVALARNVGPVEDVVNQASEGVILRYKLAQDGCTGEVALVRYKTTKDAMAAVAALHGEALEAPPPAGGVKNKKKGAAAVSGVAVRLWVRQVSGEGLHLKRWRVVVRNLSFKATEADLRAAFAPAGLVWEVTMPRGPDGKPRGFAFVGFTCRAHAERGIKAVNGSKVGGRAVAVDWAVAKRDYEQGAAPAPPPPAEDEEAMTEDEEDTESDDGGGGAGRAAGLGHEVEGEAVSDLEPEQERNMLHSVIDDILGGSDDDAAEPISDEEEEAEESGDAAEGSSEGEEAAGSSGDEEDDEEDEEEEVAEPNLPLAAVKKGSDAVDRVARRAEQLAAAIEGAAKKEWEPPAPGATVFVRGMALDVTKDQLFHVMRGFGWVRSCRLVLNPTTGNPKGTAFVDFREPESAAAVVAVCEKGRRNEGPGVLVGGKQVEVDLALDSDGARKLAAEKGSAAEKDRRNIYLSKEGLIAEGTPAWEQLSASDKNKRKRGAEDARLKLRSPNFCVSRTRLNVRNVPRSWDDKKLKALFVAAVKERASQAVPRVVQVKILREEAVGAETLGRSKGIAFVEFDDHEHSLCALRQLNNNPKTWGPDTRPIVEFAIDDVRALKKREARQAAGPTDRAVAKQSAAGEEGEKAKRGGDKRKAAAPAAAAEVDEDEGPKSKRKRRQERRRMLKERQRAKQGKADAAAEAAEAAAEKQGNKSQRRREQRKKKNQAGAAEGANGVLNISAPVIVAPKPAVKAKAVVEKGEKAVKRKAAADALVDRLASAGVPEGRMLKRRKSEGDRTERLAEAYRAKVTGEKKPKKAETSLPPKSKDQKRWFD